MLARGDTVLVAVSGGADSTALLHLLVALRPEWDLSLHVLHVDHGLRADSTRDAEAVQALGRRCGVPVDVVRVSVDPRGSLEAAARDARHAALEVHAERIGAVRIALGHTADDQAETVVMRLLEGAGLRGLAGIPPVRGRLIRPLLTMRRRELVAMLERAGVAWVEDPTNRDPRFRRNRIRHEVLPALAAAYGDVVPALTRLARQAREAVGRLERVGEDQLARLAVRRPGEITLVRSALLALPAEVAAEVLRQAVQALGGWGPLRAWAYRGLGRVLGSPPPRRPFRLGSVLLEVSGDRVRVACGPAQALPPRTLAIPGRLDLPEIGAVVEARILPASGYAIPRDPTRVAFDADALAGPLAVRSRQPGDRFHPYGAPGARRLKAFLIDAKVPRWDRPRLPVLTAGHTLVWVGGLRRGAAAPLTAATRRVLEVRLTPLAARLPAK